jgi:hypothetical protein
MNWLWDNLERVIAWAVIAFLVYGVFFTLGTPGDPFDDTPDRIPVQYPHH